MNNTIKPCPFCGTTWTDLDVRGNFDLCHVVVCGNCEAHGPVVNGEQDAIDAWNQRLQT